MDGGENGSVISVAAPGAAGSSGQWYGVAPVRQIITDDTGAHPWPDTVTTDRSGHLIVAVQREAGNALEVFAAGPQGSSTPERVISGPRTGLGSCTGFEACDTLSVTYSPHTDRIYAAVSQGRRTHISVFASDASADAAPLRTISGPATGLAGMVITGIADSQADGAIYAMVKTAQFSGAGAIEVFDRLESGDRPPLRTLTDQATGFRDAQGIAIW